jgi:hypothetical protein
MGTTHELRDKALTNIKATPERGKRGCAIALRIRRMGTNAINLSDPLIP